MSAKEQVILEVVVKNEEGLKAIGEYQKGIDDMKAKQAQYSAELEKGILKKKEYSKAINETNQVIKYNTENIRILSKEIQNNVKQEKTAAGSIDDMKAKLSNLTVQYNRLGTSMEDVGKKNKIGGQINSVTAELNKQEQALEGFRNQVGDYAKTTQSIKTELKGLIEQIEQMKVAGEDGTAEYEALVSRASAAQQAIAGVAKEIDNAASSSKGLDTMKQAVEVLTGSFTVLNSLTEVFGKEQTKLNDVVKKAQMLTGALSAAISIHSALQKESALMKGIEAMQSKAKTKALALETSATVGATAAQKVFNIVAGMNPYVLLAMALVTVVGALVLFASGTETAAEKQKKLNEATGYDLDLKQKQIKAIQDKHQENIKAIESELSLAVAQGRSEKELEEIRVKLFKAKMAMHDESSKAAAQEVNDIEKNRDELCKLEAELARVQKEIVNSGKNSKLNVRIDGKVESGKASEMVDLLQKAIDNTNKKIEIGVGVKAPQDSDKQAETERLAAKDKEDKARAAATFKEMKQKEVEAVRQAEDAVADLLEEGQQKKLQQISRQYDREIEDLKAKLATEKNLTVKAKEEINKTISALEDKKQKETKAAEDAFNKEQFAGQVQRQATEIETRMAATLEGSQAEHDLKMQQLKLQYEEELRANREKAEGMGIDESLIDAKYKEQVAQANTARREKVMQDELNAVKLGFDNKIMQMQLAGASEQEITAQKITDKQAELASITQLSTETDAEFLNRQLTLAQQIKDLEGEQQGVIEATAETKLNEVNSMLTAVGGAFGAMSKMVGDMAEDNESLAAFAKTLAIFEVGLNLASGIAGAVSTATKSSATVWDMIAGIAAGTAAVMSAIMSAKQLLTKEKPPKAPKMKSYATGGLITGEGSGTSDSIMARVSNGESIMTQLTTQMFSPILSSMNMIGGGVPIVNNNVASQAMGEEMLTSAFAKALQTMPQPVVAVEEIERVKHRIQIIESLRTI